MRVSEGHTRGFRKKSLAILRSKMSTISKIELFLTGLHFAKFIPIIAIIIIDILGVVLHQGSKNNFHILTNDIIKFSLGSQITNISY